jgi:hypothetical protein
MTDDIQHIDVDSEDFEDAPRALRDHVKKLQKALTARDQTITEFRGKETDRALTDVLAGFKNPRRVKRDLLDDGIDPLDNEAVKSWVEENGDDYAQGTAAPASADATEQQQTTPPGNQADYDRLNVGSEFRQPASVDKVQAVIAEITPDMDGAAVERLYRERGI